MLLASTTVALVATYAGEGPTHFTIFIESSESQDFLNRDIDPPEGEKPIDIVDFGLHGYEDVYVFNPHATSEDQ